MSDLAQGLKKKVHSEASQLVSAPNQAVGASPVLVLYGRCWWDVTAFAGTHPDKRHLAQTVNSGLKDVNAFFKLLDKTQP